MQATETRDLDSICWSDGQQELTLAILIADFQRAWLSVAHFSLRERMAYALRFGLDRGLRPRPLREIRLMFNEPKMLYWYPKNLSFAIWSTFLTTFDEQTRPNNLEQSWQDIGRQLRLSPAEELEMLRRIVDRETYEALLAGAFPAKERRVRRVVDLECFERQLLKILDWIAWRPEDEQITFLLRYELMVIYPEDATRRRRRWLEPEQFGLSRNEYDQIWHGFRHFVELPNDYDFSVRDVWRHRVRLLKNPEILRRVTHLSRFRRRNSW